MFKPRNRRRDPHAPEHIAYAAYLFPSDGAFRMYLRGLSFANLRDWAEHAGQLPAYHRRVLEDELEYRGPRHHTHGGGKNE